MSSYSRPIENDRSRSDEAFIPDSASMYDRAVSDSDPITNDSGIFGRAMYDYIILQATVCSHANLAIVTAKHGPRPHAGSRADHNITDDARAGRNHGPRIDPWFLRAEFEERHSTHQATLILLS